jgi:carbonic anhydrase/acetyltransferase-like protein (isoleucine patch superfamily)
VNVLIGMGSSVMDACYIEPGSIIDAGAVLLEESKVGKGEVWAGVPAKEVT